jgi:hypothetical protein
VTQNTPAPSTTAQKTKPHLTAMRRGFLLFTGNGFSKSILLGAGSPKIIDVAALRRRIVGLELQRFEQLVTLAFEIKQFQLGFVQAFCRRLDAISLVADDVWQGNFPIRAGAVWWDHVLRRHLRVLSSLARGPQKEDPENHSRKKGNAGRHSNTVQHSFRECTA